MSTIEAFRKEQAELSPAALEDIHNNIHRQRLMESIRNRLLNDLRKIDYIILPVCNPRESSHHLNEILKPTIGVITNNVRFYLPVNTYSRLTDREER